MKLKNTVVKDSPVAKDNKDNPVSNKGEGIKPPTVPVAPQWPKYTEPEKGYNNWQKKLLGLPTWTWLVAGAILVFAVFMITIVASH